MPFNIVDVESGTLIRYRNKLLEYETPEEATAVAKAQAAKHPGLKFKIKAVAIDDSKWIAREQARIDNGTYVGVPFAGHVWFYAGEGRYTKEQLDYSYGKGNPYVAVIGVIKNHFPHVSMTNKQMLSYTESSEKGAKDIQTQIKPGAYLTKFFGGVVSADAIAIHVRDWQRRFADVELKFARTPEDIVRVYQHGPNSCMSGAADGYATCTKGKNAKYLHPCEVYGKSDDGGFIGDLTVAYLESKYGVTCRCLVWEDKQQYGRIYGDSTLITRELQALGYQPGTFEGARIAKIVLDQKYRTYLMPYIDGWSRVLERPDHFVLSTGRELSSTEQRKASWFNCCNTSGNSGAKSPLYHCAGCDDEYETDTLHSVAGHGRYCPTCYDETFFYCERLDLECLIEDGFEQVVVRGAKLRSGNGYHWYEQRWCTQAVKANAFKCPVDGAYFYNVLGVKQDDGTIISQRAFFDKNPPASPPSQRESGNPHVIHQ
jgi:hypothetical protein